MTVLARLATIKMAFEVNSIVLNNSKSGRNEWAELEVAEELVTAMKVTLDREARNLLEVPARKAVLDWQDSQGEWHPLSSGAAMKHSIHDKLHNLDVGNNPKTRGLNLVMRLMVTRPKTTTGHPSSRPQTGVSFHDGDTGRNLLRSRSSSRSGSRGSSSRQSVSRNMSRDMVEKLRVAN